MKPAQRLTRWSGLVLLMLLGHLMLMASPLHATMLGLAELSPAQVGGSELPAGLNEAQVELVGAQHVGHHCAVEWSAPAKLGLGLGSGPGAGWPLITPELGLKPVAPNVGTPGPDRQPDRQALLQVFRL
jgi:hypothetical protein